jgi:hypothetical protein
VGGSEAKKETTKPRRGWKDNIKMNLEETGYERVDVDMCQW